MECSTRVFRPMSKVPLENRSSYSFSKSTTCCSWSAEISAGNFSIVGPIISASGVFGLHELAVVVGPETESVSAAVTTVTGTTCPRQLPACISCGSLVVFATHTFTPRCLEGRSVRPTYRPGFTWFVSTMASSTESCMVSRFIRAVTSL